MAEPDLEAGPDFVAVSLLPFPELLREALSSAAFLSSSSAFFTASTAFCSFAFASSFLSTASARLRFASAAVFSFLRSASRAAVCFRAVASCFAFCLLSWRSRWIASRASSARSSARSRRLTAA